jgi:FkbM family methyltransferase
MNGELFSHSYQGQDLFVIEVLQGKTGGWFLDSGASNGVRGSNTWLLEQAFGWTGLCVEPNDAMFAELRQNRPGPCVRCCLYDEEGEVDFLEPAGVLGGILETYDPALLSQARSTLGERWPAGGLAPTVRKPARTLRSLLHEFNAPPVVDYWSLDTEGSELAILQSFPFDEYSVRVLTVEHNWTSAREEIRRLLESKGMCLVRDLGIDDGYVSCDAVLVPPSRSAAWRRSCS